MKTKKFLRTALSVLLALTMLVQFVPMSVFSENDIFASEITYGDVNSDGYVNNADVELLARYLADDRSATIDEEASDVDRNGVIDLNDLLYIVKVIKGGDVSLGQSVTVTFETDGGDPIDPITIVAGGTVTVPEAQKSGAIFIGWFTEDGEPFYSSDPILEDITVYAKYQEAASSPEYTPAAFALKDQTPDLAFTVEKVGGELLVENALTLKSVDGSVAPNLSFEQIGENKWRVTAIGGYTEGASYSLSLADGYIFEGKEESIREASFFIHKEEIYNFTVNEDIIYIRDTVEMDYYLSDGTVCDVLDANVLYNSSDVMTGYFEFSGSSSLKKGDTLCIYVTTIPTERDYINGNYDNDPTAYIVVESVSGNTVSFRTMTMQGSDSDIDKLISLPTTIPYSVVYLPEGDGMIEFSACDLAALYSMYGVNAPESAKVGDFIVFYVGNFGSLRESDPVKYKRVVSVNGDVITYVESSREEFMNAINMFLNDGVDGERMLEYVDEELLQEQVIEQVLETNFAEDAMKYLGKVFACSEDFYDFVDENKITVYNEDGVKLTEEQLRAYGLGNSLELADDVELSFNVTACDGENSHFEKGLKVTLKLEAEFEADIGKDAKMGKLKIELSAAFTEEVFIDISVGASADITWIVCVPKINDIVFSTAVDVMSYTGVTVEAKCYTEEPSEDFFDKLKEKWGDTLGEESMKKIEEFKKDYEKIFEEDSLEEDIENFWKAHSQLIEEMIRNGELTNEQVESCLEPMSDNHMVQTFFSKLHIMDDEEYSAGIVELAERYSEMLGEEDNGWLELCKKPIVEIPINFAIFQISIEVNFVVRANVNVALGANLEFEVGKRFVNWFSVFGNGSGSEKLDLVDERFAFQFYAMGHIGIRVGILVEIKAGIISTKVGSVSISAEFGAFVEIYGYFQYTYTKMRPSGGTEWGDEETMMGAMYFEFGLYLDIKIKAELLSLFEKSWDLYSGKWTILSAGAKNNIYGFATELEDGEKLRVMDEDGNSNNGILAILSDSFRSMKMLDMVSGESDTPVMPWISYYDYNFWQGDDFSLTQHSDKVNFIYTLSSEYFTLVPKYEVSDGKQMLVDYDIQVDVPEGVHYLTCDLRLVWCLDKLCWSKYDIAITIPLVWTDLAEEELTEYKTATVKVGNEEEGYRTVWSDRFIKGEAFKLPTDEEVLEYAGYAGNGDLHYSGYTGYVGNNRGESFDPTEDQSLIFDTVYYFDMTIREYSITVRDVQNPDGSLTDMTFTAKYGEKFDFSALYNSGTESGDTYTAFYGITAKTLFGSEFTVDLNNVIKGNFASNISSGLVKYYANYTNNSGTVMYKFTGIALDPIIKVYKRGDMPSSDDFMSFIKEIDETAYVSEITPIVSGVLGDVVYSVQVTVPPKPHQDYTITFDSNGGSDVSPMTYEERSAIFQPQAPSRTGYTFAGWFYDEALTQSVDWSREMPSMDFTLYAKWTPKSYTVTFNAGGGTTNVVSILATYDSAIGTLPSASRANYIFLGWYDALSGGTRYTSSTVFKTEGNVTLYAHWQLKATIQTSNVTVTNKTATYNGSGISLSITNNLSLNMSSFTISYKRQNLDRNWSTALPVNAGTYDVKIQRPEDDKYLAFEYSYTGKLVVNKASRTISSSGLNLKVVAGNISVTGVPSYPGDGTQMFALTTGSFGTSAGFTNLNGTYYVRFYVAEGENYLASNVVSSGSVTVGTPYQPIDMKPTYKVVSYTRDKTSSGTGNTVKVWLIHTTGSEGSKTTLNAGDIDKKGDSCTSTLYPTYDDPWKLSQIKYEISGIDAWDCSGYKLYASVNGSDKTIKSEGGQNSDRLFQLDNSKSHYRELGSLKRKITGVDGFNNAVNLTLSSSDGLYTYTYSGKVVDQYASWGTSGNGYNAFYHTDAPTLTLSCSNSTINGFNYAQYFRSNLDTVTIDRAGLYKAMLRDGVSSITATATLTFNSDSTESGNTWTKKFTVKMPSNAKSAESMNSYYAPTDGNISVESEENMEYLYVTLGLRSNSGIWGMKNSLTFDSTKLDLISVAEGSLNSEYVVKHNVNDNNFTFVAYNDSIRESYARGEFFTLTFRKKVESVDVEKDIQLTAVQSIDDNGQEVNVKGILGVGDFSSIPPVDDNVYDATTDSIIAKIRSVIESRDPSKQTFYMTTDTVITSDDLSSMFYRAKDQLDRYDEFSLERYSATATKYTKEGVFYYTITYQMEYYLTPEEEAELDKMIEQIISSLDLDGKSDLEKLVQIYSYVCENVVYDEEANNCFTAYGALVDGEAVCQGYSLALMRLLNAVNVETDVVIGTSSEINHMWNLVNIDGNYYLLDTTWDSYSQEICYSYFLKGSNDFDNHNPSEEYTVELSVDDHSDAYVLSHSFATSLSFDETSHWYDCINCDAINGQTAHTDAGLDHVCDGGCDAVIGEHRDDDKDHNCDYGCTDGLCVPTYTVTIPATINANDELTVSASGVVLYDIETLTVTVNSTFVLTNGNGTELPFMIEGLTDGSVALSVSGNSRPDSPTSDSKSYSVFITEVPKYAGTYVGTVTFTIGITVNSGN